MPMADISPQIPIPLHVRLQRDRLAVTLAAAEVAAAKAELAKAELKHDLAVSKLNRTIDQTIEKVQ